MEQKPNKGIKKTAGLKVMAVWLIALLAAASMLLVLESDLLWMIQEKNLFLCSRIFFWEKMVTSGGMLIWVSTYLTQLFYYPWLGVAVLSTWWLLLMWLIKCTFRLSDQWAVVTLIPVALLMSAIVDTGYWLYMLKQSGHVFVPTVGTTAVVAALLGFRRLGDWETGKQGVKKALLVVYIVVVCVAGYVLAGVYGLAATLLMGIWSWRLWLGRRDALLCGFVALLAAVAVPLLMYR